MFEQRKMLPTIGVQRTTQHGQGDQPLLAVYDVATAISMQHHSTKSVGLFGAMTDQIVEQLANMVLLPAVRSLVRRYGQPLSEDFPERNDFCFHFHRRGHQQGRNTGLYRETKSTEDHAH